MRLLTFRAALNTVLAMIALTGVTVLCGPEYAFLFMQFLFDQGVSNIPVMQQMRQYRKAVETAHV